MIDIQMRLAWIEAKCRELGGDAASRFAGMREVFGSNDHRGKRIASSGT
jgi:hypothetical protein